MDPATMTEAIAVLTVWANNALLIGGTIVVSYLVFRLLRWIFS